MKTENKSKKDTAIRKVKCWEVFRCEEKDCPAYKSRNLRCWLFTGTHCRKEIQGTFIEKMEMCFDCKVFKKNIDAAGMWKTCLLVNTQFKKFARMVRRAGPRTGKFRDGNVDQPLRGIRGIKENFYR